MRARRPIHTHRHEDEYTYVLKGAVGVQVGGEVRVAGPGDLVSKPREIPHAFWNAGDEPARALEIISPGGFERYFGEVAALLPPAVPVPDEVTLGEVMARYGLEMGFGSVPGLVERHGLLAARRVAGGDCPRSSWGTPDVALTRSPDDQEAVAVALAGLRLERPDGPGQILG